MTEVAALRPRPGRHNRRPEESLQPTGDATRPVLAAIDSVATYIPVEVVGAYIASLAVLKGAATEPSALGWAVFWIFVLLSPMTTLLLYAGRKPNGRQLLLRPARWPRFEVVTATIAFILWGSALPDSPFVDLSWYRPQLAAIALIIGSLLIGLLAPLLRTAPEQ